MKTEARTTEVTIPIDDSLLHGQLHIPADAKGLVLFAHGSGSSRHSPRNQFVARVLHESGMGSLLFDLLTAHEEAAERFTRHLRFDISLLASRLAAATGWLRDEQLEGGLRVGYFGSSTGAAAALVAAAELDGIGAIVSRGGRPDLAGDALSRVTAPTLLIVGAADSEVVALNEKALVGLRCEKKLELISGATHLFEEPGTLDAAARLASTWFVEHLSQPDAGV